MCLTGFGVSWVPFPLLSHLMFVVRTWVVHPLKKPPLVSIVFKCSPGLELTTLTWNHNWLLSKAQEKFLFLTHPAADC